MPKNIESQPSPEDEPDDMEQFSYACEVLGLSSDMSAAGFLYHINAENTEQLEKLSKKNPIALKRLNLIMDIQSRIRQEQISKVVQSDPQLAKRMINKDLRDTNFIKQMESHKKQE